MENLKEKLVALPEEQMRTIQGGMRWTNDRGGNVEDRRTLGGESMWSVMQRKKSYTALEILNGAY